MSGQVTVFTVPLSATGKKKGGVGGGGPPALADTREYKYSDRGRLQAEVAANRIKGSLGSGGSEFPHYLSGPLPYYVRRHITVNKMC